MPNYTPHTNWDYVGFNYVQFIYTISVNRVLYWIPHQKTWWGWNLGSCRHRRGFWGWLSWEWGDWWQVVAWLMLSGKFSLASFLVSCFSVFRHVFITIQVGCHIPWSLYQVWFLKEWPVQRPSQLYSRQFLCQIMPVLIFSTEYKKHNMLQWITLVLSGVFVSHKFLGGTTQCYLVLSLL